MDSSTFTLILDVATPVLILIAVGTLLRRLQIIDDGFIASGSRFVFAVGMPTMLFFSMQSANASHLAAWQMPMFFIFGIFVTFGFSWWMACLTNTPHSERGVFIQIAFRGNTGVFSLALVVNMFGDEGVVMGGVLASITSILFNILAEIALSRHQTGAQVSHQALLKTIARNPMILGVAAGITVNLLGLPMPKQVVTAGKYLGSVTLPLALVCIGGSLATSRFVLPKRISLAIAIKVLIAPVLLTGLAASIGFVEHDLLYLFLFLGAPTAASAYVVSLAHGSNGKETANAIATSTLVASMIIILIAPPYMALLAKLAE